MVSTLDAAKRVLVVLLRTLAATYNCAVGVTRDSSDAVIRKAYRTMSLKTHPDKGGAEEDQQNLNNAYQAWCEAARDKGARGRPRKEEQQHIRHTGESQAPAEAGLVNQSSRKAFRIRSAAVLLTYHGMTNITQWDRFLVFVASRLKA